MPRLGSRSWLIPALISTGCPLPPDEGGTTADTDVATSATGVTPPTGLDGGSSGIASTGAETSGGSDTTEGLETGTSTGEPSCEQGGDTISWGPLSIPDTENQFTKMLLGTCRPGALDVRGNEPVQWSLPLTCTLSGRVGSRPVDAEAFDLSLDVISTVHPEAIEGLLDEVLSARIRTELAFDGPSQWIVLERVDGPIVLDLFEAGTIDPRQSVGWQEGLDEDLLDGLWHGDIDVGHTVAECDYFIGKCGDEPQQVHLGLAGGEPVSLHGGQGSSFTAADSPVYGAWVGEAVHFTPAGCTDTPSGSFHGGVWAQAAR